jgi:DNA-binding LacI/PurR family transcriptional regulator
MGPPRRSGQDASPTAGYRGVAEEIARRLDRGEWPVGTRLPSFRRFAREYDVSLGTIQRALGALKTEGRVRITPDRPTEAALGASLSSVMEGAVALVLGKRLPVVLQPGSYEFIWRGIVDGVAKADSTLIILQHANRWQHEYPAGLRHLPLRGVLLLGPLPPGLLRQYEALGLPVVLLDQPGARFRLHSVTVANYDAAADATSRLLSAGHRQIAFVRSVVGSIRDIDPDAKERQAGFAAACKQAGLEAGHQFRVFSAGFGDSSAAVQDLVRSTPRFTAVLMASDAHAKQMASAARAAGLSIPRDLSVVTFRSPLALSRDWSGPQVDFEELGRIGVEILRRKPRTIQHVRVGAAWHDGDSCGPPPRSS